MEHSSIPRKGAGQQASCKPKKRKNKTRNKTAASKHPATRRQSGISHSNALLHQHAESTSPIPPNSLQCQAHIGSRTYTQPCKPQWFNKLNFPTGKTTRPGRPSNRHQTSQKMAQLGTQMPQKKDAPNTYLQRQAARQWTSNNRNRDVTSRVLSNFIYSHLIRLKS